MAGHGALAATNPSSSTATMLLSVAAIPPGPNVRRPVARMAGTVDFDRANTPGAVIQNPTVSVYCYRLSVDRETRPGWSAVASRDGVPRLPLRMHLLVTAWDEFVENRSRVLPQNERVLHVFLTLNLGGVRAPLGSCRRDTASFPGSFRFSRCALPHGRFATPSLGCACVVVVLSQEE